MKNLILSLIFASGISLINAQTYFPFPDTNAFWNELRYYQGQCEPPDYCTYTFYFQGDTILDSLSYHKMYSNDNYSISYAGGLREINKKVYYFDRDCPAPVLLYDFGLNVGDSIALACMLCDEEESQYMKVISIDSVLIGDMTYRKRTNFDFGPSQSWIEGIGSVSGLFYPYYSCVTCICGVELVCFEQDGMTLYQNEDNVPCFNYAVPSGNLDISSEWRVNYFEAEPGYMYQSYYRDLIDGVTTINSVEYYNVYCSGYSTLNWGPPAYFNHSLHGYLREENNKWYTYMISENQDALLFDFSLEINDTVHSAYTFVYNEEPVIITSVDSILVDGEYKKRMHLNFEEGGGTEYIIEDIGATSGLFENMSFFEWGSELICFAKEGISIWGASTEECDLAVNINENQENTGPCSVFPNPAKDFTMLTIPDGFGEVSFTIIDLVGRIVYKSSFESQSTNKIKLTSCHSGIYLAIIESKGLRQAVNLIIE
jgi:hypothetical protein